jgi:hypothetical protein
MAGLIDVQDMEDAKRDADDLSIAVNGDKFTTVLTRLGQQYPTVAKVIADLITSISEAGIGDSAAALINQRMFRSGTIAERGPTPFQNYPNGLHFYVHDIVPPRMFCYVYAGQRNPINQIVQVAGWYGYYTPTEQKNLGIDFTGQLPAANVAGLPAVLDAVDDLSEIEIAGFSATALSSDDNAKIVIDASFFGVQPDKIVLSWEGYSVTVGSLPFSPPDQAALKNFAVSGNSIDDATDTPKWHTILADRLGVDSSFTARYSSDGRQTFRAGIDPLIFTFANDSLPAGGAAKAIASINGNSPIDINQGYAFLSTGDANLTTGVTLLGTLIDLQTGSSCHGIASAPNAGSPAYTFKQDAQLPAISFSGPVLFVPDISAEFARSDNFCGIGNNLFYSGVPNVYGDYTNASLYPVIDKFAAAAQGQRFMTRDVLPAGEWPADGSPNVIDGVDYKTHMFAAMEAWNVRNEQRHPGSRPRSRPTSGFPNGRTLLKYMQDHGNGSAADNTAIAQGKIPISLWSDGPHPNAAGQIVIADFYEEALQVQAVAPNLSIGTAVTLTASGTNPRTGDPVRATAFAIVLPGDLAALIDPLTEAVKGALSAGLIRPTPEAGSDLANGTFYIAKDATDGRKYIYQRVAASPGYVRGDLAYSAKDFGYPDTPDQLPVSAAAQIAITAAINQLVAAAPGALDTLKELADAIGDDPNFAATVTNALAARPTSASLSSPTGAGAVGTQQSALAMPEYLDRVVRRIGYYPQSYSAAADGVTDDITALQMANDEAEKYNGKLVLEGTYLFKSQFKASAPWEIKPGSKLITAADFTSAFTDTIRASAIINKSIALAYNPATAKPFVIDGRLEIEHRSAIGRQLLTLANVSGGEMDDIYFWTNTAARTDALVDFYACNRQIDIWKYELANLTGTVGGSCTWIRNITTGDPANPEMDTFGIRYHGGKFRHTTSDEALAIFGVKGRTRDIRIQNPEFETPMDPAQGNRHSTLISVFPLNGGGSGTVAQGDLGAAVENVIIDGITVNDTRFLDHVYRTGKLEDKFNSLRDILLSNSTIRAKQATVRTSHMARHIPCLGSNVVIDNLTAIADPTGQAVTYGALGFDNVTRSDITGHVSYAASGGARCNNNKRLAGEIYGVDDTPIVEGNEEISAPAYPVQIRGTRRYSIARNGLKSTNTSGGAGGVLINSLGGAVSPAGVIEQNVYDASNNTSAGLAVTSGTIGAVDLLRNRGVGVGFSGLSGQFRRVEGNDRFGTPDPGKQTLAGDADVTLTAAAMQTVIFNTPLTASRVATGWATGIIDGQRIRFVRTANANPASGGPFNVTFGSTSLSAAGWFEVERISGTWIKTGQGT